MDVVSLGSAETVFCSDVVEMEKAVLLLNVVELKVT